MNKSKSKAENLFSKRKNLTSNFILTYLYDYEIIKIMEINKILFNLGKEILNTFQKKITSIAKKFKIELLEKLNKKIKDKNIIENIKNKNAYHISNTKSNYIQFTLGNNYRYYALANGENFTHSINPFNWVLKKFPNGTLGKESYCLKDINFMDLSLNFQSVRPGKYKVYMRHSIADFSNFNLDFQFYLKIFINKSNLKNEEKQIYECSFMSYSIIDDLRYRDSLDKEDDNWENRILMEYKNCESFLKDSFITTIDLPLPEDSNNSDGVFYKVSVKFSDKSYDWKYGWNIDAAILIKVG